MKYWTEGSVYCDCGSYVVTTDATRKVNREREIRRRDNPPFHNQEGRGAEVLVMVDLKSNELIEKAHKMR